MRLIQLSCDRPEFHTVKFNRSGLTLIVGDGSKDKTEEGSSNGVGKTLALGLIHHCLGANADPRLKKAVPAWNFELIFEISQQEHVIRRSGDGKKVFLDGKKTGVAALRGWLNDSGIFRIEPGVPMLSFRSLFKRFGRYRREDCLNPIITRKEGEFEGSLRSLYLLGFDWSLAVSKRERKLELEHISQSLSNWAGDAILHEMFRAGSQPKVRAEWLEREIPRLKRDLEAFQVAEDYRAIEIEAGELTGELREIDKKLAINKFQRQNIDRALELQPDITKNDLLELYSGLESVFKPEALHHFDAVEEFHATLAGSRRARLERDRLELLATSDRLASERNNVASKRDQKIESLQGKRALDEYAAIARHLAALEEEQSRLREYLTFSTSLQEKAQLIREKRVEEDRSATQYILSNPSAEADAFFAQMANKLYPQAPAGIVIENNTGDNQLRYNITVQIEGDDSDGINAARILCFDYLLLMRGANHTMDSLWHDNRLFANLDPKVRASWFLEAVDGLIGNGKQYIASINTENFVAMKEFLATERWAELEDAVTLTLRGDQPENKLLGIQFGK